MSRADVERRIAHYKHEAAVLGAAALEESAKLVAHAEAALAKADKRILIAGGAIVTAAVAGAVLYKVLKD
ncbi:MAG: hypothetical protein ACPHID_05890 [Thermoplasmatota archaeon]